MTRPTSRSKKTSKTPAPRLLFTLGDPAGIGPEVVLKALLPLKLGGMDSMGVVGPRIFWDSAARHVGVLPPEPQGITVIEPDDVPEYSAEDVRKILFTGKVSVEAASLAVACVKKAVDLAEAAADRTAVITAPLNKAAFHKAGEKARGHTEWLADRFGTRTPVMLLTGGRLRVAVSTTHVPIRKVSAELDADHLVEQLLVLNEGLITRFGIEQPRIALLALNPHGGRGGEPDREERMLLGPAMEEARARDIDVDGLFSADSFFGRRQWRTFHAVMAPYHDQGITPVKIEANGAGVNTTLGLPIVRTSPDHGTAFDIAGRGVASEESVLAATRLAHELLDGTAGR